MHDASDSHLHLHLRLHPSPHQHHTPQRTATDAAHNHTSSLEHTTPARSDQRSTHGATAIPVSRMVAQRGRKVVCQQSATLVTPPWVKTLLNSRRLARRKKRHIRPDDSNHQRLTCPQSSRLRSPRRCNKWLQQVNALLPPSNATNQPTSVNRCNMAGTWDSTSLHYAPPPTRVSCSGQRYSTYLP